MKGRMMMMMMRMPARRRVLGMSNVLALYGFVCLMWLLNFVLLNFYLGSFMDITFTVCNVIVLQDLLRDPSGCCL